MKSVPCHPPGVCVLSVSPDEQDHSSLESIFRHSTWSLYGVTSCAEAMEFLRTHDMAVVVCDRSLPDGDWKELLEQAAELSQPPNFVVTARHPDDRLWAEVLNLGGYDVLTKPFCSKEVFQSISLAWRNWRENRQDYGRRPAVAMATI